VFHAFEKGEHKADLFRYVNDVFIDAMLEVELDQVTRNYEFFQGFIGSIPKHPIIYHAHKNKETKL